MLVGVVGGLAVYEKYRRAGRPRRVPTGNGKTKPRGKAPAEGSEEPRPARRMSAPEKVCGAGREGRWRLRGGGVHKCEVGVGVLREVQVAGVGQWRQYLPW